MEASVRDVHSTQVRLKKLSEENRNLRIALLITLLSVVLLFAMEQRNEPSIVLAQNKSISTQETQPRAMYFGDQQIVIGMSQTEAMNRLSQCCRLSGSQNSYFILGKGKTAEILGGIWFDSGKVSSMEQDVDYFSSSDAVNLARSLYHGLLNIAGQGEHVIELSTKTTELTNGTSQEIDINFPDGKTFAIQIAAPDGAENGVSLVEYLR